MTRLAKILIATTVLAILPATAFAGQNDQTGSSATATGSTILNGQVTFGAQWSTVTTTAKNVGGDVVIQGQGAGNMFEAVTFDDTHVKSSQDDREPAISARRSRPRSTASAAA